jgi:ribonucleoside-diphosphate reductase alpha chain
MADAIRVTKRLLNGESRLEILTPEKIHKVLLWASQGLNVSISAVEMEARIQFYDGIPTDDIHSMLVKTAANLISVEEPDYQYLAARLLIFQLRKKAFGQFEPPRLYDHVHSLVGQGLYDKELIQSYSEADFDEMDKFIDHSADLTFSYAAALQMEKKLLVQNRVSRQVYESPQFLFVLSAACLHQTESPDNRIKYIRDYYEAEKDFYLSWPTPIRSGVRTPTRQFSSCVKIDVGDSLASIKSGSNSIIDYASLRAGIGINGGRLRALDQAIRGGEARHTGLIPFYRLFESSIKSCSQGGVRAGSATLFFPIWHMDSESLIVLKNNKGTYDNRVRRIDYAVQLNGYLLSRLVEEKDITLFSPDETPGLYQAFFADQDEFKRLYELYEKDDSVKKKTVLARDLIFKLMLERANTGRIYIMFADHCNTHSSFDESVATVYQSNLCMEITLPTTPLGKPGSDEGEIALCTLSAINLAKVESYEHLLKLARVQVRALDNLLDYQAYPLEAAKRGTLARRPLGVGVINLAYYLAKNGARYSDGSGLALTHRIFESVQFALLTASCELAKERGACEWFGETKYAKGILPIDTYSPWLDEVCDEPLHHDWEALRADILKYGLRNSTLTALMPSETSSQIANATNGIEPPRGLKTIKGSKDGAPPVLVPDVENLASSYELAWSMGTNRGYLELVGVMQKFVDQAISSNTYYDPSIYSDGKVPMEVLIDDLLYAHTLGVKTLYYHNTPKDDEVESACGSDGCAI